MLKVKEKFRGKVSFEIEDQKVMLDEHTSQEHLAIIQKQYGDSFVEGAAEAPAPKALPAGKEGKKDEK